MIRLLASMVALLACFTLGVSTGWAEKTPLQQAVDKLLDARVLPPEGAPTPALAPDDARFLKALDDLKRANDAMLGSTGADGRYPKQRLQSPAASHALLNDLLARAGFVTNLGWAIEHLQLGVADCRRLYERVKGVRSADDWRSPVREWLRRNTAYFRDELVVTARDELKGEALQDLYALKRLDPARARALLAEVSASKDPARAMTAWFVRLRMVTARDVAERNLCLRELRRRTERATGDVWLAGMVVLSGYSWPGQESWVLGQMRKKPPGAFGVRIFVERDPARWLSRLAPLMNSPDLHMRAWARRSVFEIADGHGKGTSRPLRVRALALCQPWFDDPRWLPGRSRWLLASVCGDLAYAPAKTKLRRLLESPDPEEREAAAGALLKLGDRSGVAVLEQRLSKGAFLPGTDVERLHEGGALDPQKLVNAVEAAARLKSEKGGAEAIRDAQMGMGRVPSLATIGANLEPGMVTEVTATALLARITDMEKTEPAVVVEMKHILYEMPLRSVHRAMVADVVSGKADAVCLECLVERADDVRKDAADLLEQARQRGGSATGVAVAVRGVPAEQVSILRGTDSDAVTALLACVRVGQALLPEADIVALLCHADPRVVKAAERYLAMLDTPSARAALDHPGRIVGNDAAFDDALRAWEGHLQREQAAQDTEIIAFLGSGYKYGGPAYNANPFSAIVRLGARSTFALQLDPAWGFMRELSPDEVKLLRGFIARWRVDDQPVEYVAMSHPTLFEYLHLDATRGRRVTVCAMPFFGSVQTTTGRFLLGLERPGMKVHFNVEDAVPGVELLLHVDSLGIWTPWAKGTDVRILCAKDGDRGVPGNPMLSPGMAWRAVTPRGLRAATRRPADFPAPVPLPRARSTDSGSPTWIARAGGSTWWVDGATLYCAPPTGEVVRVLEEVRTPPVATPDGSTILVAASPKGGSQLFLLDAGKRTPYRVAQADDVMYVPLAWLPTRGEWVVMTAKRRGAYDEIVDFLTQRVTLSQKLGTGEVSVFSLASGKLSPLSGEVSPLMEISDRGMLQSAGEPEVYWVARPSADLDETAVGRYDTRTLAFTEVARYPRIQFSTRQMWVDAEAGKVYVSYQGNLLRMPLEYTPAR